MNQFSLNHKHKHKHFLQIFSTGPQFSEYVQDVCRNTNGTCLKSVPKTPTFRFFRDFQPLKRLLHTSSQMANFDQFFAKMAKTVKIIKKALGIFFSRLQALTNCKVSEKVTNGFREKALCTSEQTYGRMNTTPKVSNDRWSRDQKVGPK